MGLVTPRLKSSQITSKAFNERGRLPNHDPAKNKIHSEVSRAVKAALAANIETKCTITASSFPVNYNGTIVSLTGGLGRGDASINQATGIVIKPIHLRFDMVCSMSAANSYNTCRVVLFRWMDSKLPLPSDILGGVGNLYAPQEQINWINKHKIKVLRDYTFELYDRGAGVSSMHKRFELNPGSEVLRLPESGAGSVPVMNGLYALLITDDAIAGVPLYDIHSTLQFTDA